MICRRLTKSFSKMFAGVGLNIVFSRKNFTFAKILENG